jgi:hypothetical protein
LSTATIALGVTSAGATTGEPSWSGQITNKVGTSTAQAAWDQTTGGLSLQVSAGALAEGYCVTTYFDWTAKGHHDARAVRNCQSNSAVSYTFTDATPTNITGGPVKPGICHGPQDKKGTCVLARGTKVAPMDWTPWPDLTEATPCDLSWVRRNADGTTSSFIDPNSLKAGFASGTSC